MENEVTVGQIVRKKSLAYNKKKLWCCIGRAVKQEKLLY